MAEDHRAAYSEDWARTAAMLIFFGFNLTFFPQFVLGAEGMPRRYHVYPPEFQVWNVLSSGGATILAAAYLLPLFYLGYSLFFGARAPANPWDAPGLEWQTTSPPPEFNFAVQPVVTRGSLSILERFRRGAAECLTAVVRPAICLGPPSRRDRRTRHVGVHRDRGAAVRRIAAGLFRLPARLSEAFMAASRHTEIVIGAANTAILLTSSFLVACARRCAATEPRTASRTARPAPYCSGCCSLD